MNDLTSIILNWADQIALNVIAPATLPFTAGY